jgi:hypothetical protein
MATFFAILAAFPFGWCLGLFFTLLIAGTNIGQTPIFTVPLGILAALIFAFVPVCEARTRLNIMLIGTPALFAFFLIVVR